jgi:hypothetical protein
VTLLITNGDISMRDRYFELIEEAFVRRFHGRPHWAKSFTLGSNQLNKLYPRYGDFIALRDNMDPKGMFANAYLDRVLGVAPHAQPIVYQSPSPSLLLQLIDRINGPAVAPLLAAREQQEVP